MGKIVTENLLCARERAVEMEDKANSSYKVLLYCGRRQKRNKIISDTGKHWIWEWLGGRWGCGLLSRLHQACLSEKMVFKIKQRSGRMISAEETANTKDRSREREATINHYILSKYWVVHPVGIKNLATWYKEKYWRHSGVNEGRRGIILEHVRCVLFP